MRRDGRDEQNVTRITNLGTGVERIGEEGEKRKVED
jgi:hypothetical protein